MKKTLLVSVSIAALFMVSEAGAADLAVKAPRPMLVPAPVYSWTGCYVGAQVGWGRGRNHTTQTSTSSGGIVAFGRVDSSGGLFGGQVGCNYQFSGNWVAGIQGDFAGTDINGKVNDPIHQQFFDFDGRNQVGVKTDWLASATARLGYTFYQNQGMLYVKGGAAWVHNQWDIHDTFFDYGTGVASETKAGWTVGAGAEWKFTQNWSGFAEFNYYQFNRSKIFASEGFAIEGIILDLNTIGSNKQQIETVKVGVNYSFTAGPVVARY